MKKRLWAIFLSICLVVTLLPTMALAEGNETVISSDTTWESETTLDHDLTISTGATLTVKGSIIVQGAVTVSGGGTIKRAAEYNAEIFNVSTGNSLTLNGVVLDGGAVYGNAPESVTENTNATAMKEFLGFDYENNTGKKDVGLLIDVAGGSLVMRGDTVLQNNATSASARDNYYNDYPEKRTCAGIGVRAGGIFTMEGGQISRMVGPSVLVNDLESKFIMSGGEISNSQGNAVLCYGEMKMTAGSISHHTNTNNTAVGIRGDNASFYMDGGEISNNFGVGGNYGTIMATSGAAQKIDLLGGQIYDNKGTYGTALVTFGTPNVHIGGNCKIYNNAPGTGENSNCVWIADAGGTLLIDGNAKISNNTASPTLLIDCTATLAGDAKIENNTWTGRNGYAVNVRAGSATIKDQFSISNNISYDSVYGTGLYISKGTTVNMMGGVIKNNSSYSKNSNSAYYHGGGVSFEDASAAQLNLSGNATISGNKTFVVGDYENLTTSNTIDSDINLSEKAGGLTIAGALTTTETIGILDGRRASVNNTVIATGANNYSITDADMTKLVYSTDTTHNPEKTIYLDTTANSIKVANAVNVTLHANNGTDETAVQKVPESIPTQLQDNPFTYPGHTFVEWNTADNGTGDSYKADVAQTFINNKALYAKWRDRALSSIEVTANKTSFAYGTVLRTDDFTVTAVYDNGERETVTEFSVSPNTALTTPGTVQVTVTYQGKTQTCGITVDKASQAAPTSAPTLKDRTYTSITLNTVEPNANGAAAQYSKDGGQTWQELPEFIDLTSGTTYTFAVRYAETDTYKASPASATAEFSTLYRSSGSSSNPTYSVSTPGKTENGSVTVSPKNASKGDRVTITVKPDSGYTLETLTVIDSKGNEIQLTDKGEGKYTFTMPAGKVEVKATFMDDNTMLNFFVDVKSGDYYYDAVLWAARNGITSGTDAVHFSPEQPCTRAQIVTFLWRAAGAPEPKGTAASLTDVASGSYYEKAVAWAIENGITTGTGDGEFSPDDTCTRAQAVTFLARALNAKAAGKAEFSDVSADSYFADAVAWAAANGVTEGVGNGMFAPDNDCTRGQIVTFLFRAYNK